MSTIVCKFGGTSVATSEKIKQVAAILRADPRRRCAVLSAPGKAAGAPVKVTDALISIVDKSLLRQQCTAEIAEVKRRFNAIYEPLGVPAAKIAEITGTLDNLQKSSLDHPGRYRDRIVASGEDMNCRLFAEYLNVTGAPAVYVSPKDAGLVVTPVFGDAQPLPEATGRLSSLKEICERKVAVFPGFFGYTADGEVATFSRGGSDLTGSILAEAIDAIEYENWTDVDGIFSAHPAMVEKPQQITGAHLQGDARTLVHRVQRVARGGGETRAPQEDPHPPAEHGQP